METRFLYKAKGFNFTQNHKFKIFIIARSFDDAAVVANQLAGSEGWVSSIKDMNKKVLVKGES